MKEKRFILRLLDAVLMATAVEACRCGVQYLRDLKEKETIERIEKRGFNKGYNKAHEDIVNNLVMFKDIDIHSKDATVHARMIID